MFFAVEFDGTTLTKHKNFCTVGTGIFADGNLNHSPLNPIVSVETNYFILTYYRQKIGQISSHLYKIEGFSVIPSSFSLSHGSDIKKAKLKTTTNGNMYAITWNDDELRTKVVTFIIGNDKLTDKETFEYNELINPDVSLVFLEDEYKGFLIVYETDKDINGNNAIQIDFKEKDEDTGQISGLQEIKRFESTDNLYHLPSMIAKINSFGSLETIKLFYESKNDDREDVVVGIGEEFEVLCPKGEYFEYATIIGIKCEECETDSYKDFEGNNECTQCPIIRFTNGVTGAEDINDCICKNGGVLLFENCIDSVILTVILASGGIIGGLIGGFVVAFVFFVIICICCVGKFKKKANRFDHIEGVDMILKEAELDQMDKTENKPKIKIKESNYIIDFKEIKIIKTIGQGASSSVVYLADWNGIKCAFKGFSDGICFGNRKFFSIWKKESTSNHGKNSK